MLPASSRTGHAVPDDKDGIVVQLDGSGTQDRIENHCGSALVRGCATANRHYGRILLRQLTQ